MKLRTKAGQMVRLFLCLLFSTGAILAEEKKAEKIPRHWIEEAKKYDSRDYSAQLPIVPKYERELVRRIREHILATNQGEHADYKSEIPETGVEYEMVAIEGGKFLMGSPEDKKHRNLDEGPQREIEVSDFWMGKYEVTWDQAWPFAARSNSEIYTKEGVPGNPDELEDLVHWISSPSTPYTEMDFGMGLDGGYPAINMSHHAVTKFCQWLSTRPGIFTACPRRPSGNTPAARERRDHSPGPEDQLAEYAVYGPRTGSGTIRKSRNQKAESLGTLRHARKRDGMVSRCLPAQLWASG